MKAKKRIAALETRVRALEATLEIFRVAVSDSDNVALARRLDTAESELRDLNGWRVAMAMQRTPTFTDSASEGK